MVNYEDIPDNNWMIRKVGTDEIVFHADTLPKTIEEFRKDIYDNEEYYLTKKIKDVIALKE